MEELIGSVIGFGITALLFLAGVLPIYFIMKKISGSKTTFAEDLKEYFTARPQARPEKLRPETLRMLSTLDSVESGVLHIYKYVLIIGLILGSVFIVWFFINVQDDVGRFLFGAGYLFLVVWVVGSFVMIKRRQSRISGGQTGIQRINFQIQQATETIMLNESSLQAARIWIAAGETIESVCGYINPEYKQWDAVKRQAFEGAVKGALAARMPQETAAAAQRSPVGMTRTTSPAPEPAVRASFEPAPPPGVGAAPSKDAAPASSALTPQQIVIVVMVFLFAVGTFSFILLMLQGLPELSR
jgi:hypothetical protein